MSSIGPSSHAQASAIQAAQAQQVAGKARDAEKARAADARRALQDHVDLRVDEVETNTAIRKLPQNSSEQQREEHDSQAQGNQARNSSKAKPPRIDYKA